MVTIYIIIVKDVPIIGSANISATDGVIFTTLVVDTAHINSAIQQL